MNNWLIRTKSNYILGPISRQKLIDLIASGAIGPEDEVASGNGYWIFVREKNLLEKYLYQGNTQGFNPVSEALNERVVREKLLQQQQQQLAQGSEDFLETNSLAKNQSTHLTEADSSQSGDLEHSKEGDSQTNQDITVVLKRI